MRKRSKAVATPYLAWMVAFIVLPLAMVIFFAFTDENNQFTLANISALSENAAVFLRSLIMATVATLVCLIIAYPISYMLSRMRPGQQSIVLMLVMLPMWMNFLLRTYAWMSLLENNGLINKFLGLFGIGPFQMINTSGAVVLGMVYNYLPFMILPLYTAMLKIDQSVVEAAEDLGAGPVKKLFRVLLPLSRPGINTGIIMVFVPSVSTFAINQLLGGGQKWLIGDLIEAQFKGNSYNPRLGSAMSLVLMVVVLICMSFTGGFGAEDVEGVV